MRTTSTPTRRCPHCGWDIDRDAETCTQCLNPVPRFEETGKAPCYACRVAAGVCGIVLAAGVIALIYISGAR